LLLGTLLAVRSNSWFTSWVGLEINLISMAPLILVKINKNLTEACLKYFLVQALASTLLIVRATLNLATSQGLVLETLEILIFIALLMKAGIPPLHFWFPELVNKLNWTQCFILFTWQKVAPLLLLSSIKLNKLLTAATLSVVVGALGGLNQILTKPIMAYSSIAHRGWILTTSKLSLSSWFNYFSIYVLLSLRIIATLKKSNTKSISEISTWQEGITYKCMFSLTMLSLGGLPPFLGFLAKISVILLAAQARLKFMIIIFVITSLISLYFYLRLLYTFALTSPNKKLTLPGTGTLASPFILVSCTALNILTPIILSVT